MIRNFLDPKSNDNALFITAQCNNRCLMCCQPPSSADDLEFHFQNNCRIIGTAETDPAGCPKRLRREKYIRKFVSSSAGFDSEGGNLEKS